jgi:hypothetical protein
MGFGMMLVGAVMVGFGTVAPSFGLAGSGGLERAILDFHARSFTARTLGELDNLIAAVSDYNEEVEDKDIELDLELLDRWRANLVRNGVPDSRAGVPANPWPAD